MEKQKSHTDTEDTKARYDISNYELDRPLPKEKKSNWINERSIRRKIKIKFVALKPKTYSYLIDEGSENEKSKGTKHCAIKTKIKFENDKTCLRATQLYNKIVHELAPKKMGIWLGQVDKT